MTRHPVPLRRQGFRWQLPVLLGLLALAAGVLAGSLTGHLEPVVGIASLVVAALALVGDLVSLSRRGDHLRPDARPLADALAVVLREEWYVEAGARHLRGSRILPLTWKESEPAGADRGPGAGPAIRLRLDGRLESNFDDAVRQLALRYRQLPDGRLVLLGEPGSGKSALVLLLAYGLVLTRTAGTAVPVLLSASSWDPLSESVDDWMSRMLADAYYSGRSEVPRRLLEQDLVVPIIDGLDEIPESSRHSAIQAVNGTVSGTRPIVVTCRSIEYRDLIEGGSPVLRRAPVVEAHPVPAGDLFGYFRTLEWPAGRDWTGLERALAPDAPAAQALSTPLMISLAATVYQRLDDDPGALLSDFDSRHAVEDHLIDRGVDAAYTSDASGARSGETDPAEARRRLTMVARYLHEYGERDFVWWRLGQRLLSPWMGAVLGISGGALLMIAAAICFATLDVRPQPSLDVPIIFGAATGAGGGGGGGGKYL